MSQLVHKIEIANEQPHAVDSDALVLAVQYILTDHQIEQSEISIAIVDDPAIRELNRKYLSHDYATDVISFVLDFIEPLGYLSGQLIVSTDTAQRVSRELGGTMQDELLLYVIHGTLHLVGYDDKTPSDAQDMRDAEKTYLEKFGVEHRWSEDPDPGPFPPEVHS